MEKNIEVPVGKLEDYKEGHMGANEWVVYNTNQIKMRYIAKFKIN
jgi:hypothetical protein